MRSRSTKIYYSMVVLLAGLSALSVFLPIGSLTGGVRVRPEDLPASKPVMALAIAGGMLVIYGGLGRLGLAFSRKLGYPDVWDDRITQRQRFVMPAVTGLGSTVSARPKPPVDELMVPSVTSRVAASALYATSVRVAPLATPAAKVTFWLVPALTPST